MTSKETRVDPLSASHEFQNLVVVPQLRGDGDSNFGTSTEKVLAEHAAKTPNLICFIEQFPLAMAAIAEVHDYERGPLVKGDYRPPLLRHLFGIGDDLAIVHKKKVAWNAIADLEVTLRRQR